MFHELVERIKVDNYIHILWNSLIYNIWYEDWVINSLHVLIKIFWFCFPLNEKYIFVILEKEMKNEKGSRSLIIPSKPGSGSALMSKTYSKSIVTVLILYE